MGVTPGMEVVFYLNGEDDIALADEYKQQEGRKLFLEKIKRTEPRMPGIITAKLAGSSSE